MLTRVFSGIAADALALELSTCAAILTACRFTSFIATNASRIAKSLFAPAIGPEPNARAAARRSWPRNFPFLLPPPRAAAVKRRRAAEPRDPAGCAAPAGRIRIEYVYPGYFAGRTDLQHRVAADVRRRNLRMPRQIRLLASAATKVVKSSGWRSK
jgi:hypothetical protein